jgi:hypothetical protein
MKIAFVALIMALGGSARADWQYTRWGMAEAEVVAASNGSAVASDARQQGMNFDKPGIETKLTAPYTAGPFAFDARFSFSKDKGALVRVQLWPVDKMQCTQLQTELGTKYGRPTHSKVEQIGRTIYWKDDQAGNVISFSSVLGITCYVSYDPIVTPVSGGL